MPAAPVSRVSTSAKAQARLSAAPPAPQEAVAATKAHLLFTQDLTTPYCWVCDRQDSTIRRVSYPIVVGLGVPVLRRAFEGMWCEEHARQRRLWAILLTALFGWWALPLGPIRTLHALWTLMRGGQRGDAANVALQEQMATIRHQEGDLSGEARCWEAIVALDPHHAEAPARLAHLYEAAPAARPTHPSLRAALRAIVSALAVAVGIGIVVELGATLPETLLALFGAIDSPGEAVLIAAWRLTWALAAALAVGEITRRVVRDTHPPHVAWALALGAMLAALALYAQISAQHLVWSLRLMRYDYGLSALGEPLLAIGSLTLYGGVGEMRRALASPWLADHLRLGLWGIGAALYAATALSTAWRASRWRDRIDAIAATTDGLEPLTPGPVAAISQSRSPDGLEPSAPGAGHARMLGALVVAAALLAIVFLPHDVATSRQRALQEAERGFERLHAGHPDASIAAFERSLSLAPDLAATHVGLGHAHGTKGDLPAAIAAFEEARRRDPAWIEPILSLGWAHLNRGGIEDAANSFEDALAISPESGDALLGLGRTHLARRQYALALEVLGDALDLGAHRANTHLAMGEALYALHKPLAAIENLRWSLEYSPECTACQYLLAVALADAARYDEAIAAAERLAQFDDLEGLGTALVARYWADQGKHAAARAHIERAMGLSPEDGVARWHLGVALAIEGRHEEATRCLHQALDHSPGLIEPPLWLGTTHARLGHHPEAWSACDRYLALGLPAHCHAVRAQIHNLQGDWRAALTAADLAVALDATRAEAHVSRSLALLRMGRPSRALDAALAARVVDPYCPAAYDLAAQSYLALGEIRDAEIEAKRALQLLPRLEAPHYVLGECYRQREMPDRARESFAAFLECAEERPALRRYVREAEACLGVETNPPPAAEEDDTPNASDEAAASSSDRAPAPGSPHAMSYHQKPVDAAGYHALGGEFALNPNADVAVLDGIITIRMQ